jgi:hypothetical protein
MSHPSDLFIRIHKGIAVFYPQARENIDLAFPDVDLDNPENSPVRFEKARMIPHPVENIDKELKVWEELPYTFNGTEWVNDWQKRDMTQKEQYEFEISSALTEKRERQINKYLESVGIAEDAPEAIRFDALNKVGPDYVFSLDVD